MEYFNNIKSYPIDTLAILDTETYAAIINGIKYTTSLTQIDSDINALFANLVYHMRSNKWIGISRKKDVQSREIVFLLDYLIDQGFIKQILGNHLAGMQTVIKATDKFIALISGHPVVSLNVLKKKRIDQDLVSFDETLSDRQIKKLSGIELSNIKENLLFINASNKNWLLECYIEEEGNQHPGLRGAQCQQSAYKQGENSVLKLVHQLRYKRIFGTNLNEHGRFYTMAQNINKENRKNMFFRNTKTGETFKTVELDYSSNHLLITYDKNNITPPKGDLYSLNGFSDRKIVKAAAMMAINCKSKINAIQALNNKCLSDGTYFSGYNNEHNTRLMEAFIEKHSAVKHLLFKGNMQLMNDDARIAEMILMEFARLEKPILCIHDSFVVAEQDKDFLMEQMIDTWRIVLHTKATPRIDSKTPMESEVIQQAANLFETVLEHSSASNNQPTFTPEPIILYNKPKRIWN